MDREKKMNRRYCIALGCLNTNKNRNISLFKLPKDIERRNEWLTLIGREDLLNVKNFKHYSHKICSDHFEDSDIMTVRQLKINVLPTRCHYNTSQAGINSSGSGQKCDDNATSDKTTLSIATQTEKKLYSEANTQVEEMLLERRPRKQRLDSPNLTLRKKKKMPPLHRILKVPPRNNSTIDLICKMTSG